MDPREAAQMAHYADTLRDKDRTIAQLQHALDSRVVIEQAKGFIAGRCGVGAEEAFQRLRSYARSRNERVAVAAQAVMAGSVDPAQMAPTRSAR